MKKICGFFTIAVMLLSSCEQEIKTAQLNISEREIYLSTSNNSQTCEITSTSEWTATCDAQWIEMDKLNGEKGTNTLTILAKESATDGSASILLRNEEGLTDEIKVTYNSQYFIHYTTTDQQKLVLNSNWDKNTIESHTYGLITFNEPITSIPHRAFNSEKTLASISIPSSVTSIGNYAFFECSSLTSVTIPNSVTSIGEHTFAYCGITSINIPNSVTSIGRGAFTGSRIESVTIPNNVTSIDDAFYGCDHLTSVIWNVINHKDFASSPGRPFDNSPITNFTFGESVEHIPSYLCYHLDELTEVTIGKNVTSIGINVFEYCEALTTVKWNAINCEDFSSSLISDQPFRDLPITTIIFGEGVEQIPAYLCYWLDKLTQVNIPNSVKSIREYAFGGCSSLTSITIPNSVTNIGRRAFAYCEALTSITIPSNVAILGEDAFYFCPSLTSVTWDAINCQDFTTHNDAPFSSATKITSFTFGDKVEHIPAYLCYNLDQLTGRMIIPSSVISIGEKAFSHCTSLTELKCKPTTPPSLASSRNTFDETNINRIFVPSESLNIYKTDPNWSYYSDIINSYIVF